MTEPTDRDRKLFFDALEDLREVMAIGGPAAMLTMGKYFVPSIAAAREEGRREERERCAKIADEYAEEVLPVDPGGVAWLIAGRIRGEISVMDLVDYLCEKT